MASMRRLGNMAISGGGSALTRAELKSTSLPKDSELALSRARLSSNTHTGKGYNNMADNDEPVGNNIK